MFTKDEIITHEAGHLLFLLKNIYTYENITKIESITVDHKKQQGIFYQSGVLVPEESHYKRALGGAAMDFKVKKLKKINELDVLFNVHGWQIDIYNCIDHGYTTKQIFKTIKELSKQITDDDLKFVEEVKSLFKGNTKVVKSDKLLPIIKKYLINNPHTLFYGNEDGNNQDMAKTMLARIKSA